MRAGQFLTKPKIEPSGEGFTCEPFVYVDRRGRGWGIGFPGTGFFTDFASVPRVAVWLIPRFGKYTLAAIVHDWYCAFGIRRGEIGPREADLIFREIMQDAKVTFLMRWLMWTGVRWGAAFNPIRRDGWWRDFPKMIPCTVLALPMLLPAAVSILFGLVLFAAVQLPASLFLRREKTTTGVNPTT